MCKWKKYPVGHPEVLIGPKLQGKTVEQFEGMIRCTILLPTDLDFPLLPSKINGKLVFTLCRKCAELQQTEECTHRAKKRALTETWISTEVQKAVSLGYVVIRYTRCGTTLKQHVMITQQEKVDSNYMNELITIKMEASCYPSNVTTDEEKEGFVKNIKRVEGVTLDPSKIEQNPVARAVAKLCLNSFWGEAYPGIQHVTA